MCNNSASHVPANLIPEAFSETAFWLRFDIGTIARGLAFSAAP